jgi:AmmeMemoRadiSam system protein A
LIQVSKKDGLYLLELARIALEGKFQKVSRPPSSQKTISFSLLEKRGIFVALWKENQMRGCIGSPFPTVPLKDAVIDCAIRAASEDSRFPSVKGDELAALTIEVSILSSPKPVIPDEIQLGVHGVIVSDGVQHGLILPVESQEWTIQTFLEAACLKGGLTKNAWKEGANLYSFEVQSFKEC